MPFTEAGSDKVSVFKFGGYLMFNIGDKVLTHRGCHSAYFKYIFYSFEETDILEILDIVGNILFVRHLKQVKQFPAMKVEYNLYFE